MEAATGNGYGYRDATMILVAYRHGLRASDWEQVDLRTATLHVRRVKKGIPSTHLILGDELRALRRLQREQEPKSPFVFTSERGAPFTIAGFARMLEWAGAVATLPFKAHPHMLKHACGYALANRGHDTRALQAYLGHAAIKFDHTVLEVGTGSGYQAAVLARLVRKVCTVEIIPPLPEAAECPSSEILRQEAA
jgi:integrase